jgi:hypothetical protein
MRKKKEEIESREDEFLEQDNNLDEEQKDDIISKEYSESMDSDLDIYRKNIEPKSQDLGFRTNTRDLKMSNIGNSTEVFIQNMSTGYTSCREKFEVRKVIQNGVELESIYNPGFGQNFLEIRDRTLILANSRQGYWQNLQIKREITHHKIEEQINESKPIVFKNKNNNDENY